MQFIAEEGIVDNQVAQFGRQQTDCAALQGSRDSF